MRVLFNPRWNIDFGFSTRSDVLESHSLVYTAIRPLGKGESVPGHSNWDYHYLEGWGAEHWMALMGQLVGTPITPHDENSIKNIILGEWMGKHYLFYIQGNDNYEKRSIFLDAQEQELAVEDIENPIARNLALDVVDLLSAPLPGATPMGIPGQQLTIGGPWFGAADATNKKLEVSRQDVSYDDYTSRDYIPTFWDPGSSSCSLSASQMTDVFEVLFEGATQLNYRWFGSNQIYGLTSSSFIGMVYNGMDNMVGIEIMHTKADKEWESRGILYNKSLCRFVWGTQIVLGRILAALDAGKAGGGSSTDVDYTRIQSMINSALSSANANSTSLAREIENMISSSETNSSAENGAIQFNQAVGFALLASAYRKMISPKRMQQAIDAVSRQVFEGTAKASKGDKQSRLEPNMLDIFMAISDEYGRLITEQPGDEEDGRSER
jgi:hypothetical protein